MTQLATLQARLVSYHAQAVKACEKYDQTQDPEHFEKAAKLVEKINETADVIEWRTQ